MARNVKTTKTPEQRRAEAEELQATIAEQVEALRVLQSSFGQGFFLARPAAARLPQGS